MNEPDRRYPILGGLYWAVFNSNEADRLRGYDAVLRKHGAAAKRKMIAHIRKCKGVMAVFELPPKGAAKTFAEAVANSAEARRARKAAQLCGVTASPAETTDDHSEGTS